jgi:hypothetical protein
MKHPLLVKRDRATAESTPAVIGYHLATEETSRALPGRLGYGARDGEHWPLRAWHQARGLGPHAQRPSHGSKAPTPT